MKYAHIPQKPYCCVAACVQMIFQRRKLPLITQESIAYELGVVLPPDQRHLLPKSYKGPRPKSGWGTRIQMKKYSLNAFFRRRKLSLEERYYVVKDFRSPQALSKFLVTQLKEKNDLLTCFNYPRLYNLKGSWGHASLIESVKDGFVFLRDPDARQTKLRKVKVNEFFEAIKGFSGRGVWAVSSKD